MKCISVAAPAAARSADRVVEQTHRRRGVSERSIRKLVAHTLHRLYTRVTGKKKLVKKTTAFEALPEGVAVPSAERAFP